QFLLSILLKRTLIFTNRATSHPKDTRSISACNNKMHPQQTFSRLVMERYLAWYPHRVTSASCRSARRLAMLAPIFERSLEDPALLLRRLRFHIHINLRVSRDLHRLAPSQIFLEHAGSQPLQLPPIFNRYHRIFPRVHSRQAE